MLTDETCLDIDMPQMLLTCQDGQKSALYNPNILYYYIVVSSVLFPSLPVLTCQDGQASGPTPDWSQRRRLSPLLLLLPRGKAHVQLKGGQVRCSSMNPA